VNLDKDRHRARNETDKVTKDLLHRALVLREPVAEERLWQMIRKDLARFAQILGRQRGLRPEDEDEVVQTACVRLVTRVPMRLMEIDNLPGWLFRLVGNAVTDVLRSYQRKQKRETSLNAPLGPEESATLEEKTMGGGPSPSDCCATRDLLRQYTERFLPSLSKDHWAVFRLYLQNWSQAEIAKELGIPVNTVGVIIWRVHKKAVAWREELER